MEGETSGTHPPSPRPPPPPPGHGRVHLPPPPPSRELLAAREREKGQSAGEQLVGQRLGQRGGGGLAGGSEQRAWGSGASVSGHRIFSEAGSEKGEVGEAGSSSPAEASAGPGVCRVAGPCGVWSGSRPVATCILSFIYSDAPASPEAHLCQAWSLPLEPMGHN